MLRRYPPGPVNWNALIGLTWRHAFRLWWNALGFLDEVRSYGDICFFRLFIVRAFVVNHPDLIRQVLITERDKFRKLPHDVRAIKQIVGDGILVTEGDVWLRQRRLVQPAFHTARMGRYAQATVGQTHRLLDRWSNVTAVDVPSEMSELTMRIAAQTMFDIELDDQSGELVEAARHLSDTFIREIHSVFTLPNFLPLPHKRRKRAAIRLFDKLIRDIIHQRRASGEDKGDLLSMLLLAVDQTGDGRGMTDQQVRDEAMTLFTAAFHASSMALTWTWYLLAKHPNVCARLVREVDVVLEQRDATFEDVARLTYTQMVLKESLRLYPPAWALFCREAQAEIELGGYRIPRKSWVFLFPYVTHRDSRFFPDPERFDPERFSPEREKEIPQYAYFPFGAGPRVCIGNMFAMMEMTLVIATLVQKLTLALLPNQPDVQMEPLLALRPRSGLTMSVSKRPANQPVGAGDGVVYSRD